MLNIRKRIFLFLTIIGIALFFTGCTDASNTVRLNFDQDAYTVRMYEQIDITPIIQKSASLGDVTVIYETSDDKIATFKGGIITPMKEGTVTIKIYWLDKPVVFDKATVTVIKAALPVLDLEAPSKMLKGAKAEVKTILAKNYTEATVSFKALTPEIATISEAGEIEALAVGTAKFEAIVADYEDSQAYPFEVVVQESDFAINYELAGGTNNAENPVGYNALKLPLAIAPATKVGYEFKGWLLNNKVVDAIPVESLGDVTLKAKWEIVNYKVTYENDGEAVTNPATYNVEQLPLALAAPTKVGYTFAGWQLGEEVVQAIPAETIGDVTVKATWKAIEYKATFDKDGGKINGAYATREEMVNDFMKDFGAYAGIEMTTPAEYWKASQKTSFWKNAEMFAKWSWIFKELIPLAKAQDIDLAYLNGMLANPINITGYATQNVALFLLGVNNAKWNETYSATYGGLSSKWTAVDCTDEAVLAIYPKVPDTFTIETELELPTPEKLGYAFLGWYDGDTKVEKIAVGTTGNVELKAKWELEKFDVTFDVDGGKILGAYATREEMVNDFMKDFGAYAGIEMTTPAEYWKASQKTSFWKNAEMFAKWSWIFEELIPFAKAQDIDLAYLNGMLANPINITGYATQNVALFLLGINNAKWNETYSATYGGLSSKWTAVDCTDEAVLAIFPQLPAKFDMTQEVELPTASKEGYTFLGWYDGDTKVEKIAVGTTKDVELKAKWELIPVVSNIVYNLDGGELAGEYPKTYVEGTGVATLPVPTKTGYVFDGWFIGDVKQTAIGAEATGNVELTAHWTQEATAEEFDIAYDLNGGTWSQTVKNGYTTYDDIVADVLKDFGMTSVSVWASDVDDKFRENMTKWGPLLDYFIATRGNTDGYLQQIKDCRAGTDLTGDANPYVVTGEFKAFVEKTVITYPTAEITSNDYSVEGTRELIWTYFTKGTEQVTEVEHTDKYQKSVGLATLPTPLKANDTFAGWYVGEVKWESIPVGTTGSLNLKARWESEGPIAAKTFDIIYNLDGGELATEAPKTYTEGVGLATLPVPTKEGYTFLGWYVGDVKQESISAEANSNVELTAKWKETIIEPADYTLTFNLDGGSFAAVQFANRAEVMKAFLADMTTYLRSKGSQITEIMEVEDLELNEKGEPRHVSDFMGVSYNYAGDIEAFFTTAYAAKWGWMYTFIKNAGAQTSSTTLIRANVHSFVYQTVWAKWPYSTDFTAYDFDSFKDQLPEPQPIVAPDKYETGKELELPVPSKEGMEFVGWFNGSVYVEKITTETRGNLELTAKWRTSSGEAGVVEVSAEGAYKTLAEAMAVVKSGETIKVLAGTYEGGTINVANVKVQGPNAGVDPNTQVRSEEAIFTSDIIVAADGVTIDGVELTGLGRIVGDTAGAKNTTIQNVYVYASTVNPTSAESAIAPLTFYTNVSGAVFENLVLANLKYEGSKGRPMILYGAQIVNFSLKDSSFVGTRSNYNDGIKFENTDNGAKNSAFGVKGNVTIESNLFENYSQYVIWFREYAEGTYNIQNNTFKACGQTAASHAAVNFITYKGSADSELKVNVQYNTVDNSYMIARIDAAASRTEANTQVHINYNKLYNSAATHYIKNSYKFNVDGANNWYDTTPVANKFLATVWEPFYANVADVPAFGQPLNFHAIGYELNGGSLPAGTPATYDSTTGLSTLPTPTYAKHIFLGWYSGDTKVDAIAAGTTGKVTLVAKWREDALYVGAGTEDYLYATIAAALEAAKEGDKIIILAGEYEESFTVTKANLTIVGANQDVNPNTGTRAAETILKGAITVNASAANLTLKGLAFTGSASIKNMAADGVKGLVFENNKVYDTVEATAAWKEAAGYTDGFMVFVSSTTGLEVSNFMFKNNLFENVSDANVVFVRSKNISFDGNVFKDFDRDAIRFDTGGFNYGTLAFTNNKFEQTVAGNGNHAIYFRIYGGPGTNDTKILIQNNDFIKIGNSTTTSIYNGAIGARNYQEAGAEWIVIDNLFDHCVNIARIRNNATAANHATSTWSYRFENNQILGVPTSFYYANKNSTTESDATNPSLATFGANYYEDNEGNVITDLTAYAAMFKEVVTMGTALAAKPGEVAAEIIEFYSISYDLDGGTAKGTFVNAYDRLSGAIAIPVPTKTNHQFLGWDLNGAYVTEVPATQRGDIVITAKWQVLEGEIYTIEYVTTQGNWPTRAAEDREEIIDLLWADLYEWATTYKGYTGTLEAYKAATTTTINEYTDISLRNGTLKDAVDEEGNTAYFYNIPKYYEKWAAFFRVFDEAMLAVNNAQSFFTDIYATMVRFSQFLSWSASGQNYFASYMPRLTEAVRVPTLPVAEYRGGQVVVLPVMWMGNGLKFIGWFDNAEFTGEPIVEIPSTSTGNVKYYAKWEEVIAPTEVTLNTISEILRFESHQLVWTITPTNATDQRVEFVSSNEAVAKISAKGLITYVGIGSTDITMKVIGNRDLDKTFTVTYYSPDHIEGSFKGESYVKVGETIELEAAIVGKSTGTVVWTSENPDIATVDANGVVTAVKAGLATIVAKDSTNDEVKLAFIVSVLDEIPEGILGYALKQHNSNVFFKAELGIGAGVPVYYADILGSVSKMLFLEYTVDTTYYTDTPTLPNHSGTRTGALEFITVHYTGNMNATAGAGANARYFAQQSQNSSIHYVTGNDGVFYCYDESLVCWHAGDGTAVPFEWNPTGVLVKEGDPESPVVTITANAKFAINGTETTIAVPSGQKNTKVYGKDLATNPIVTPTDSSYLTCQGLAVKVVDGQYLLGSARWDTSQVADGKVCSYGGNLHSIGIESAVNKGTDLWLTWQKTAQLVARLMQKYSLDITRVKGHVFFSGKDCPQPLLENDCEIWGEFIKLVEAEYEALTVVDGYTVTCVSNNPELLDNTGRIIKQPQFATCVSYTLTFTKGEEVKTITLSSLIPGVYEK